MSLTDNNSNILRKNASDILDQIRKRAEDISTSEGSNFIFHNLSNPTNLTNPQIISLRNNDQLMQSEATKISNKNFKKRRTRNIPRPYKRMKEVDDETIINLHDQFLISEDIKRLILRKGEKIIFNKSYKKPENLDSNKNELFQLTNIKKHGKTLKKNRTLDIFGEEGKEIWDKLAENIRNKREKIIRVNDRKNTKVLDYITRTKNIQLLRYIHKNKKEKLNILVNLRTSEINTLNDNIESLENSKDLMMTNYDKKYIKYINYLKKQKDKEEKAFIDLLIKSGSIKKEIFKLQTKISKVHREKMLKLNLILLFIQIKERIKTVPDIAFILFGAADKNKNKNLTLLKKDLSRQSVRRLSLYKDIDINKINEKNLYSNDTKKIMKYKGKLMYNDPDEVFYDLSQIEESLRRKIIENEDLKFEIKGLNEEYNHLKEEDQDGQEDEKVKHLQNILNRVMYQNEQLQSELNSIIVKYNINNDTKFHKLNNILTNINKTYLKKSSSSNDILTFQDNRTDTNNQFFNTFQMNENSPMYNPKTILTFKKYFSIEKFNFNTASNLFLSCYNLYNTTKDNFFLEQDLKFDVTIQRGSSKEPEKKTILKMVEYIASVHSLLIKERNIYLSDKILKKKYEKIKELCEKEKRRKKIIDDLKKNEEKRREKLKKLNFKKDKFIYISTHKIENKYFFKAQKDKKTKAINLAQNKKPPGFEDFMYDVMV